MFSGRKSEYETLKADFLLKRGVKVLTNTNRADFIRSLPNGTGHYSAPSPHKNKGRILMWMAYWPFSATWTLINDPLKHFWRWAYTSILGMLEGISNGMFASVENDFKMVDEAPSVPKSPPVPGLVKIGKD
jgi:hypothetical protein